VPVKKKKKKKKKSISSHVYTAKDRLYFKDLFVKVNNESKTEASGIN